MAGEETQTLADADEESEDHAQGEEEEEEEREVGGDASTELLSKRQQKKALKRQRAMEKRATERASRKEAKRAERERRQRVWDSLTEEEQAERKKEHAVTREARLAAEQLEAERKAAALSATAVLPTCAIDLSFDDLMNDREIASLAQQLSYCHSANRRAGYPMRVVFASLTGRTAEKLCVGAENWTVQHETRGYLELFKAEHLIYLSSESDTPLDTIDPTLVYVVGGLVDHNRHKGLTHRKAVEAGVRTARLPIDEHLDMSQRRVLAVNHVVDILVQRATGLDWPAVLMNVMPERRHASERGAVPSISSAGPVHDEGDGDAAAAGKAEQQSAVRVAADVGFDSASGM